MRRNQHPPILLLLLLLILLHLNVSTTTVAAAINPFSPKAHLIRYWNNRIYGSPHPSFLLSKASPLSPSDSASFSLLASLNSLPSHLSDFCSKSNLLCFPDLSPSLSKHSRDVSFSHYSARNFTNYGSDFSSGSDSFKNYSDDSNLPVDSFRRYSRDSSDHSDSFSSYASDGNVASQTFNTYGDGAVSGDSRFSNYASDVNVPDLKFTSYSDDANARRQSFSAYSANSNAGTQAFAGYGKSGNGDSDSFVKYGDSANVLSSGFSGYSEGGNGGNDSFTSYGDNQNVPENTFKSYGDGGNGVAETFTSYRDDSNVGDDSFQSYAKNSNSETVQFSNYGKSFNQGSDKFSGYGKSSKSDSVGFNSYGLNNTFKDYSKSGPAASFSDYANKSTTSTATAANSANKWIEPGKFFRESMLKSGQLMPMPDIADKMPARSFLPKSILDKIPFSSSQILAMKQIFHAFDNSSMETMLNSALKDCERPPALGETKRCVGSGEDMIDFAVSVLGNSVELRTTESTAGSKGDILIGEVRGINGGSVTKSVSCHQTLYPYLLYYCHSVPKVRVYEADILDPKTKARINSGVAICHLDTSGWSATHGAFIALGPGPGSIEACHWIFENDLTWAVRD